MRLYGNLRPGGKLRILLLTAVVVAAITMATPVYGANFKLHMCNARQTATVELSCAQRNIYHATFTLIWIRREHSRTLQIVPIDVAKLLKLARLKVDMTWLLSESKRDKIEALHRVYLASFPPHHNLWLCLHGTPSLGTPIGHEASSWNNHNSGGNGHYGGLQMTPNWMGQIRGTADNLSQLEQEWAAERGYRASGYSHAWLGGQWAQTIGPCWAYA